MTDRPTIEERYIAAARSSNLRLRLDKACDVDMLIAAGWIRETLATMLHRLRAEFDTARRPLRAAANDPTEQRMAMMRLKSLHSTRDALGRFATMQADRKGIPLTPGQVQAVVGSALDAVLDPLCGTCSGSGKVGDFGASQQLCHACRGSGRRRIRMGGITEEAFGRWLVADMEQKIARVDALLVRFVSQRGNQPSANSDKAEEAAAELANTLRDLRSDQAAAD